MSYISTHKKLKIIVGKDEYPNSESSSSKLICNTTALSGCDCYDFYQNFHTVAFLVNDIRPYKVAFESILHLLYYQKRINIRRKYVNLIKNNSWQCFVEEMYLKHKIVFINQDEIDKNSKYYNKIICYLNSADAIIACGDCAQKKINSITTKNVFKAIHPTPRPRSVSNQRYIDDWIDIKTTGTFNNTWNHSIKSKFMI